MQLNLRLVTVMSHNVSVYGDVYFRPQRRFSKEEPNCRERDLVRGRFGGGSFQEADRLDLSRLPARGA